MRALLPLCLVPLLALSACKTQPKATPGGTPAAAAQRPQPPYDLSPLRRALRPGSEAEVVRKLGLKTLWELPYYQMALRLDPAGARLQGRYTLHLKNRRQAPLPALPLLLHPNAPRELAGTGTPPPAGSLRVTGAKSLAGPKVARLSRPRPTLTRVVLARPLAPGARLTLEVRFSGTLRRLPQGSNDIFNQALASLGMSGAGSGASDYGLLAQGDGIITVASAYPMLAPYREGGFDTSPPTRFGDLAYNELCHFHLRLTLPAGYRAVTNLHELEPWPASPAEAPGDPTPPGQTVTYSAAGAANRDLVLVAGRDLRQSSRNLGEVTVRSVFRAGDRAGGERVLRAAAGSLELFQRRFGPYPYRQLDVAEATLVGGAGGVEFPGMVLVAGMLYRSPSRSGSPLGRLMKLLGGVGALLGGAQGGEQRAAAGMAMLDEMIGAMAEFTTAHEVAHQYFAGLVGSDSRQEPALDEPLAQFAAGEYMRQRHGAETGQALMDLNARLNYAVYRMVGGEDAAVARPVSAFASPLAYAAIVYGKAPYFYPALRTRLGEERFWKALGGAVAAHRYQLITLQTWLRSLERGAGLPAGALGPLARRWFFETHGDADLGVDGSGEVVLGALLGQQALDQLKGSLRLLGMEPKDLFRGLLGPMMQ